MLVQDREGDIAIGKAGSLDHSLLRRSGSLKLLPSSFFYLPHQVSVPDGR
jgi:hypothetical protein